MWLHNNDDLQEMYRVANGKETMLWCFKAEKIVEDHCTACSHLQRNDV